MTAQRIDCTTASPVAVPRRQRVDLLQMLIGLRVNDDDIVVSAGPARLKTAARTLPMAPARLAPDSTASNHLIIAQALFVLANLKNGKDGDGWQRGSAAVQMLGDGQGWRLYLYEAGYRATIYPRYWWDVPHYDNDGFASAAWHVFCAEWAANVFTGHVDTRACASVAGDIK